MNAPATLVSLLVCYATFCGGIPTTQSDGSSTIATQPEESKTTATEEEHLTSVVSGSNSMSSSNGMVIKTSQRQVNGECKAKLSIFGNGIDKTVDYPCGKVPKDIINLQSGLLIGEEWYSDQPKTLIHLSGNQCTKEVFSEQDGKITASSSEHLSDEDCQKVHTKITELKKEAQRWKEWLAQKEEEAKQQLQKIQQSFSQMFSNFFGNN